VIIDTSALVSILDQESEAKRLAHAIATASERMLSAANLVETGIVMQVRRGDELYVILTSCWPNSRSK
jgi:uncharacterized protein with PIN domain